MGFLRDLLQDDDDRVDGRDLPLELAEPGSDERLLLGLLLFLAEHPPHQHPPHHYG